MSELQTESVESEVNESPEVENLNTGAELAPASESEHEAKPEVDEEAAKQAAIQKTINKKHFETQQAKRDLEAANSRIAEFESKQREEMAAKVGTIPPMPDSFDDDFDEKVKERDEALIAQANFNSQNQSFQAQQQLQQQQAAQAKNAQVQESMASYSQKATELGIAQEELQAAGNTVAQYGLSDDLVMHILADSDGPLITKHLAANPQEGFQLAQMSPFMVGSFLDGIRQKASALKPKTSNTPKPGDNLQGAGHKPSSKYKHISGAKFE
jgi:two-component sensor histidine kinase